LIKDLTISAKGSSSIAAEYGAFIMRELEIFDTIRISNPRDIRSLDFQNIKYGGFLTVTQSGSA
jgi:hypothetical protein